MTDPVPSKDLLPCPFCGSLQINVVEGDTFRWRVAECGGCGAHAPDVRIQTTGPGTPKEWEERGRADALAEWNQRAAQPPPANGLCVSCVERITQLHVCATQPPGDGQ